MAGAIPALAIMRVKGPSSAVAFDIIRATSVTRETLAGIANAMGLCANIPVEFRAGVFRGMLLISLTKALISEEPWGMSLTATE